MHKAIEIVQEMLDSENRASWSMYEPKEYYEKAKARIDILEDVLYKLKNSDCE